MRRGLLTLFASALAIAALAVAGGAAGGSTATNYTVAFNQPNGLPADVDQMVAAAGGQITIRLPEIGGIGVSSDNPNFAADIAKNASVKSADVSAETGLIDPVADTSSDNGGNYSPSGSDTQPMPDPLGPEQWDKKKLNATLTGSYGIQRGRKDVRVFVIDTGADQSHIDVAPNLDVADSRSFVPTEPTIQDFNGHGTWTISAVGAPINSVGISGVAPGVTLVEGKVLNGAGRGQFL